MNRKYRDIDEFFTHPSTMESKLAVVVRMKMLDLAYDLLGGYSEGDQKVCYKAADELTSECLSLFKSALEPPTTQFKAPFRVGKRQGRAVLDRDGLEVVIFPKGLEEMASHYCKILNSNFQINKQIMTDLEKYQAVNKCENLKELADVIRSFADDDGFIQGRTRKFSAEHMAKHCESYQWEKHNALTREFGIRQQAMMLLFYEKL
jgi:hypothetical protein